MTRATDLHDLAIYVLLIFQVQILLRQLCTSHSIPLPTECLKIASPPAQASSTNDLSSGKTSSLDVACWCSSIVSADYPWVEHKIRWKVIPPTFPFFFKWYTRAVGEYNGMFSMILPSVHPPFKLSMLFIIPLSSCGISYLSPTLLTQKWNSHVAASGCYPTLLLSHRLFLIQLSHLAQCN